MKKIRNKNARRLLVLKDKLNNYLKLRKEINDMIKNTIEKIKKFEKKIIFEDENNGYIKKDSKENKNGR